MRISLIVVVFLMFLLEFSSVSNAVCFTLPEGKEVSFTTGKFVRPEFEPKEKEYLKECDKIISNEDKHDQVIFYVTGIEVFIKKLGKWESITDTNCKLRMAGLCIKRTELLKISEQPFNWKSDPIIPTMIGKHELNISDDIRQCYESCYLFFKNLKENISEEGCKDEYKEWASEYTKLDESKLTLDEISVIKCIKKMPF